MHVWSEKEDLICAEAYIKKYLIDKDSDPVDVLPYNLYLKLGIDEGSIKMKLQNIKYFLEKELKMKHISPYTGLYQYSSQCFYAICIILHKYGIKIDLSK